MNLTLSVDRETVERARAVARKQGTSVNRMIRDYLGGLARSGADASSVDRLLALMDEGRGSLNGERVTRAALHDR